MTRAGFSGRVAERRHVGGDPAQRPHEQVMQREIDQRRGDRRRSAATAAGCCSEKRSIASRSGFSSSMISTNSPPIGAGPTTRMTSASLREQRVEGVDDGAVPATRRACRCRWSTAGGISVDREQAALLAHLHGDRARADRVEDLARHRLRHHAARRRLEHQRGGVGGGQAVVQPVQPEIGDRRHIDQHFRDHHEQDREDEQLAGQAQARHARAGRSFRRRGSIRRSGRIRSAGRSRRVGHRRQSHPKRRSKPMMRRTQGLVKLGVK